MPVRRPIDPALSMLLQRQLQLLSREQALAAGFSPRAIAYRLAESQWQLVLPDVYLTHPGQATREQLVVAALLFAGPGAAVDDVDACNWFGLRAVHPDPLQVHLLVPKLSAARSRDFVVVRRTDHPFETVSASSAVRFVEPATAVIALARRLRTERQVVAVLSEAVQRRVTDVSALLLAHQSGPPRGSRLTRLALDQIVGGARSSPEAEFRRLATTSLILPPLLYNPLLQLPSGRLVSPDALDLEAGLVHEVNGKAAHARQDLFDDMQQRHDWMTVAGLIVMHNTPRRVFDDGATVLREFEECHLRYAGRGLPAGIQILRASAA